MKMLMKLLTHFLLCFCLVHTQTFANDTGLDALDGIDDKVIDELKDVEISPGLQQSLQDYPSSVKPELTEEDRKALRLLGYSDAEIDQLSMQTFLDEEGRETFSNRVNNYADKKKGELEEGVMGSLVPGLASSVIGLGLASLLGVVLVARCTNQPSALAFSGTAVAWVGLEMMIWKGYQIRMDDINTLMKATEIPKKVTEEVNRAKKLIKKLENEYKSNPSFNFENFLEQNKEDVDKLRAIATTLRDYLKRAKDQQFGALRSIQESIELAAETSKKKSRNATVAAVGFAAAAALAAVEGFGLFGAASACTGGLISKKTPHHLLWSAVPSAHAGFASVGDLDKIGIPVGAGMAAAYVGFKQKFADMIYKNGTGRAISFTAMAGMATLAAVKLKEAAKFLDKQAKELDIFATAVENQIDNANVAFGDANALIQELKKELIPQIEEIGKDLAENELKDVDLEDVISKVDEEDLDKVIDAQENIDSQSIADSLSNIQNELPKIETSDFTNPSTSSFWLDGFLRSFIEEAHAAYGSLQSTPVSCFKRTKTFLLTDSSCKCRSSKTCARTPFPRNLKAKSSKLKGLNEFGQMAIAVGRAVNKSSDRIMYGNPKSGLLGFNKLQSTLPKLNAGTKRIVSSKLKKKVNNKTIAKLIGASFKQMRPALKDYYKSRNSIRAKKSPVRAFSKRPALTLGAKVNPNAILKASIREKINALKSLGNSSVQDFEGSSEVTSKNENHGYNYSKGSISKDPNGNIFDLIKKRYLIIQSEGRL